MSSKILILVVIAVECLFLRAGNADPRTGNASIKIGALLHLSGDLAMQGAAFREGIELAVASINSSGGIGGTPIAVVFEDTELKPSVAYKGAKKLLELDGVVAGLVSTSAETKAAGSLFEAKKVPLICLWDSSPEVERLGQHVFGIGTWTPSAGEKVAEYAYHKLGTRRAAVIFQEDEWALTVTEAFADRFASLGGALVFNESLNPDSFDFRSVISRMMAKRPDLLYAPFGFNTAAFLKQLRQLRFGKPIFESDTLNDEIISAAGQAAEGVYQTQSVDPEGGAYELFANEYKEKFGRAPSMPIYAAWGYDGVELIARAIKSVGPRPALISGELYKTENHAGASGNISISSEGSSRVMVGMYRVTQGKLRLVER
jgi:branched-chain amino acid transport system substrate-binding protein